MARPRKRRAPHAGSVYRRGAGSWRIRWRENGQRRYLAGYLDRETAELALAKILGDLRRGEVGIAPNRGPVPTCGELFTPWYERRKKTHRSAKEDHWRWEKHLRPFLAHLQPAAVDSALLRRLIEAKLSEGLSSTTVRLLILEVSGFFTDSVEQGHAAHNPVRLLPRSTRRLIRPAHDPRTTPFLERIADVRRVFLRLPEPINVAFALGAMAGLRTGEILALDWQHVDLTARRIHIRESVEGPLKDDESRVAPIQDALFPVLAKWRLKSGGEGRLVPPMRSDGTHCDDHTLRRHLKKALLTLGLLPANDTAHDNARKRRPRLNWYRCTRHTFASHWTMAGGSIEKLKEILGHSTIQVTERYSHLRPEAFSDKDRGLLAVDLAPGKVVSAARKKGVAP